METNLKFYASGLDKREITVQLIPEVLDFLDKHKYKDKSEIISEVFPYMPEDCDEAAEFYNKEIGHKLHPKDNDKKRTFIFSEQNMRIFWNVQSYYEENGYILCATNIMNLAFINYFQLFSVSKRIFGGKVFDDLP